MKSKFDYDGESLKRGRKAETGFVQIASKIYEKCEPASRYDNTHKHIDYYLWTNVDLDLCFSVDVKAKKRISRTDTKEQNELIWVEIKNVRGNPGWIYGEADKIAFAYDDGFLMVDREKLMKFCVKYIDFTETVDKSSDALYKLYQRRGRKDVLSLIRVSDIEKKLRRSITII